SALRQLQIANLNSLDSNSRTLHLHAVEATADACVAQIMRQPAVTRMAESSQELATRLSILMQQFELAATSPEVRGELRQHLQQQLNRIVETLNSPEMQQRVQALTGLVNQLRQAREQMPPGSIGRARLDRQIQTLEAFLDLTRPTGQMRTQLATILNGIQSG